MRFPELPLRSGRTEILSFNGEKLLPGRLVRVPCGADARNFRDPCLDYEECFAIPPDALGQDLVPLPTIFPLFSLSGRAFDWRYYTNIRFERIFIPIARSARSGSVIIYFSWIRAGRQRRARPEISPETVPSKKVSR
jgi:hypothetical protein